MKEIRSFSKVCLDVADNLDVLSLSFTGTCKQRIC